MQDNNTVTTPPEGGNNIPGNGDANTSAQEGQKTFTQEQLNAIVGERLAKEKTKSDAALAAREKELADKEFRFEAKEMLIGRGLPADLLDALNTSSREAFEKSLSIITPLLTRSTGMTFSTSGQHGNLDGNHRKADPVRGAFGLKEKGK